MYKNFTDMPIWQKAMDLSVEVFNLTTSLPRSEDYGLTSQIRRSSNSVPSNIAEGFGRYHKKDKINFYYFACGSVTETQSHLIYGDKVGYFEKEKVNSLFEKYNQLRHDVNKVIKTIRNSQLQPQS